MVKVPKENRHLIEHWEVAHLIDRLENPKDKSLIVLYYRTGIRAMEAFTIRKEDIWIQGNYLYIRVMRQKKSKKEVIPIPSVLSLPLELDLLQYIVAQWKSTENGHFIWDYGIKPSSAKVRIWREIKKLNSDLWIHLFRHSLAEYFRSKGATTRELMAWFGWTDMRTAGRYTHPSEKTIKKLGRMLIK